MFNFDGQLVADALFIQRMGDTLQGIREHRAATRAADLQQDLLSVIGRYNQLHAMYNNLADRYNGVLAENKRIDAAHAQELAGKDSQIAELGSENRGLRTSLMLKDQLIDIKTEKYDDLLYRHNNGLP